MDRLRDFASRNKRPFQFSLPNSLSRRHLTQNSLHSQTQASNDSQSVVNILPVVSRRDVSTQTDSINDVFNYPPLLSSQPGAHDDKSTQNIMATMVGKTDASIKQAKKYAARKRREKTEQELFDLAATMAAQSDTLSDSGRDLSNRLNEMARDVLEANKIVERKGTEISELNEQLRVMQLSFDKAHFQLQQAQDLADQVVDKKIYEHDATDKRGLMEGDIRAFRSWVTKEDVKAWPADRIEKFLCVCFLIFPSFNSLYYSHKYQGLQILHDSHTQHPEQLKAISEDIESMAKVFRDVECDPKYAALLSIADDKSPTDRLAALRQAHEEAPKKQEATYRWGNDADLIKRVDEEDEDDEDEDEDDYLPPRFDNMTHAERESFARYIDAMIKDERMQKLAEEFWRDEIEEQQREAMASDASRKTNKATASKTAAAAAPPPFPPPPPPPRAPSFSSTQVNNKGKKKNVQEEATSFAEDPSGSTCNCFACHVAKWVANQYGDEAPETLRNSFLQSINGMESGLEGFVAATRMMPPEFRLSATDVSLVFSPRPCNNNCYGPKMLTGPFTTHKYIGPEYDLR